MSTLGKDLDAILKPKLPGCEMGLTDERPSVFNQQQVKDLTLYYLRDQESQKDLERILDKKKSIAENVNDPAIFHKHIFLGVRIHQGGLEVGLWLHQNAWVDWKNVVERCREYWEMDKLKEILVALPDSVRYARGDHLLFDSPRANQLNPQELIENFARAQPWSILGEWIERQEPITASPELVLRLSQLFECLIPLLMFIRWRRENDFHQLKSVLKEHEEKAKMQFASFKSGDEVRILKGLAAGRIGVVDALEKKGTVKVRVGTMVIALKVEDLGTP